MTFSRPRFAALPDPPVPHGLAADLAVLFRTHHLDLVRLATLLTGDQATAEDVVQDAFERVYVRWGRLAASGVSVAYIRAAVVNGCRAVHRRRKVVRRHGGADDGALRGSGAGVRGARSHSYRGAPGDGCRAGGAAATAA